MNGYRVFSMVLAAITIAAATDTQAADELTVSKKACAGIVAYNSGTNVHGRKVAPSHLGAASRSSSPRKSPSTSAPTWRKYTAATLAVITPAPSTLAR